MWRKTLFVHIHMVKEEFWIFIFKLEGQRSSTKKCHNFITLIFSSLKTFQLIFFFFFFLLTSTNQLQESTTRVERKRRKKILLPYISNSPPIVVERVVDPPSPSKGWNLFAPLSYLSGGSINLLIYFSYTFPKLISPIKRKGKKSWGWNLYYYCYGNHLMIQLQEKWHPWFVCLL